MSDYLFRFFNTTREQLIRSAESVVQHAAFRAAEAHHKLTQKHPMVATVSLERWTMLFVAAAAFVAMRRLDILPTTEKKDIKLADKLMDTIDASLARWNSDSVLLYLDCIDFYEKLLAHLRQVGEQDPEDDDPPENWELQYQQEDCDTIGFIVGCWIVLELFNMNATEKAVEELQLALDLGMAVCDEYFDYWKGQSQDPYADG